MKLIALVTLAAALCAVPAQAQQARKWVEPDGRVIYSDVQPSRTARLAGAVRADAQPAGATEKFEAGKVELIEGPVTVTGNDAKARRMLVGSILYVGDAEATGDKGELHADMADGAVIAVRPNSQVSIIRYRARGQSSDASVMSLLRGSFRSITGFIAKAAPNAYEVRTPIATIGVRGTDHEPMVIASGSADGQPGVYDKVNIGSTVITANNGGAVTVPAGQAGFIQQGAQARPQVLASIPAAFKGSANDGRMQGRHERVQQVITEKRSQAQAGQGMQKGGGAQGGPSQAPGKGGAGSGTPGKDAGAPSGQSGTGPGAAGQAGPGGQSGAGPQGAQSGQPGQAGPQGPGAGPSAGPSGAPGGGAGSAPAGPGGGGAPRGAPGGGGKK